MFFSKNSTVLYLSGVSTLALTASLFSSALKAEDVDISNDRTSTVTSSTEMGTSSGTLTLSEDGSITVSDGTALIINGPHSLVQTGAITSNDLAAGRGILVDSSAQRLLADFQLNGQLDVGVPSDSADFDYALSTDNVGVLFDGEFGSQGSFEATTSSAINVWGADSRGIWLKNDMTGDFTNSGTIATVGDRSVAIDLDGNLTGTFLNEGTIASRNLDGTSVKVSGELDGALINRGSIFGGANTTTDDDGNTVDAKVGKAAIFIENNITGGILIDGIGAENERDLDGDGTDDITADSDITTYGGTRAIAITNSGTSDLIIGTVANEAYDRDYALIMRGNASVSGTTYGYDATGMTFEGASETARTILEGGILFDTGDLSVVAGDADATGIIVGNYASVSEFNNSGTLDVDTTTSSETDEKTDEVTYGPGGDAVGILIAENGELNSVTNSGTFSITSRGDNSTASGIIDNSGTLSSFTNTGTFLVQSTDDTNGTATALDLRANTSGVTFENSGDMSGDVYFGSGDDSALLSDGIFNGSINFGSGTDSITLNSAAEFNGSIHSTGNLDVQVNGAKLELNRNDSIIASSMSLEDDSTLTFNIDPNSNSAGSITLTNGLTVGEDAKIITVFDSLSTESQTFNLVTAGSIDIGSQDSLTLSDVPYLFNIDLDVVDGNSNDTLTLSVTPKTAEELNVSKPLSALYNNMITSGVELDTEIQGDLAGLTTKSQVEDALASILPDITNSSFNSALINKRQIQGQLTSRMSDYTTVGKFRGGAWAREVTTVGTLTASQEQLGGDILTVGLSIGYDQPVSNTFVVGISSGFMLNGVEGDSPVDALYSSFTPYLAAYGFFHDDGFYAGAQLTGQYTSIQREKNLTFNNLNRVVESKTSGWNLMASLEAGYELEIGGFHLKPYGSLSAQKYTESGYTESGANSVNFTVSGRNFTRTEATFGASLGYDFKWKKSKYDTRVLRPEVFYSQSRALSSSQTNSIDAIFVGGDTSFALEIDQLSDKTEQFGGSFSLFSDGAIARVNYAKEKLDDVTTNAFSVNFALSF